MEIDTVEELVKTNLTGLEAIDWVYEQYKDKDLISIIRLDEESFNVIYRKKPVAK